MTRAWKVTHRGGKPTYHDTEALAERERRRLEAAQPGVTAYVYPLDVDASEFADDEEFCATCFAGVESGEHLVKCGDA